MAKKGLVIPANYKTELCRNWQKDKKCPYGKRCVYAHDLCELRTNHINMIAMTHVAYLDAYSAQAGCMGDPNYFYASVPCADNPHLWYNPYAAAREWSSQSQADVASTYSESGGEAVRQPTPPVYFNHMYDHSTMDHTPWSEYDPFTLSYPPTPTADPDAYTEGSSTGKKKKKKKNKKKKKKNQQQEEALPSPEEESEEEEDKGHDELVNDLIREDDVETELVPAAPMLPSHTDQTTTSTTATTPMGSHDSGPPIHDD